MSKLATAKAIAHLNDSFRRDPHLAGGMLVITDGVNAEGTEFVSKCVAAVRSFETFTEDNDPRSEHDFGSISIEEKDLFWKIDYYEAGSDHMLGAEDPSDPSITERVLTIMLCEEY
jgi:hypothetical protein